MIDVIYGRPLNYLLYVLFYSTRRRIDEIKRAKELLEKQLSETIVKIGEMEESCQSLERAIAAKQPPLATCQRKIQQRKQRPNIELVADDVDAQV